MKIKIIVNPVAGAGRPLKLLPQINEFFKKLGIFPDFQITQKEKEATYLAQAAEENGCELIVALGGDGTVNEIVNGLKDSRTILAVIPAGTGNDFARMLHLPKNLEKICQLIAEKKYFLADVGAVNNQFFVNNIGLGFEGETAAALKRTGPGRSGFWNYLLAVFKALLRSRPVQIHLKSKEMEIKQEVFLASIANGQTVGGGFRLAPNASISDGLLDVCVVDYRHPLRLLLHLPKAIKGTHIKLPFVKMYQCSEIQLEAPSGTKAHFDGEVTQVQKLSIKILPKKLKVIGTTGKNE